MDVAIHAWTPEDVSRFEQIAAHSFETPDIDLDFTGRLARTLGWTRDHARRGVEEYRRFCFLACVSATPVTPSEEVDEVWHLHLVYTRDYWDRWCKGALGRSLHHDATAGGPAEQSRHRAQYAQTLALYEGYFGPPPTAFWPSTQKRFGARPRFRMIDRESSFVLPRPSLRAWRLSGLATALAGLATALAGVVTGTPASAQEMELPSDPLDWTGTPFLELFAVLILGALTFALLARVNLRPKGAGATADRLSCVEIGYLVGGMRRAADTLFLELADREMASMQDKRLTIQAGNRAPSAQLQGFRSELAGTYSHRQFLSRFKRSDFASEMIGTLARRNLVMTETEQVTFVGTTLLPFLLLACFGLAKIVVGMSRDRPVGFLVMLVVFTTVVAAVCAFRDKTLTQGGKAALESLRQRSDRAMRAPLEGELPLAFALVGVAVLAGTPHAAYAALAAQDGGGSGCSGSGGCGGGGGCGGCGG